MLALHALCAIKMQTFVQVFFFFKLSHASLITFVELTLITFSLQGKQSNLLL